MADNPTPQYFTTMAALVQTLISQLHGMDYGGAEKTAEQLQTNVNSGAKYFEQLAETGFVTTPTAQFGTSANPEFPTPPAPPEPPPAEPEPKAKKHHA